VIKNERQFRVTEASIAAFRERLDELDRMSGAYPKIEADAIRAKLRELEEQLSEYARLRNEQPSDLGEATLEDLPDVLVKARIASGLSQRQLADLLGMKEQQIQRYEATNYEAASFVRVLELAEALNLEFVGRATVTAPRLTTDVFWHNLQGVGLERDFVLGRLIPAEVAKRLGSNGHASPGDVRIAAESVAQIYGWSSEQVFSGVLTLNPRSLGVPRYKTPKGANAVKLAAYAVYARALAEALHKCTRGLKLKVIPTDPAVVYERLAAVADGGVDLIATLTLAWEMGVPVLPLSDPGAFHAACWRIEGQNVVVLKQKMRSESRWTFDLLHEIRHAADHPELDSFAVLEGETEAEEEEVASKFAGDVLLGGLAEDLAQECVRVAGGSVERLKSTVVKVAAAHQVDVASLANYLAFRLSGQGLNWWGAAANLQKESDVDPWQLARDFLLERISLSSLGGLDRELLARALQA